jgi:hypothetical protein
MRRWNRQLVIVVAVLLCVPVAASAELEQSTSYSMNESEIGGNGQFNSSSTTYKINPVTDDGGSSLGESAVGSSASANYSSGAGFNTTAQPGLTMTVNTGSVSMGPLSAVAATTGTATFDVTDYTSYGYAVQVIGSTPVNPYGRHLTALATDTASVATTEQFGINTRSNSSPASGTDPQELPDATFSFGVSGDGSTGTFGTTRPYTIPNQWRFNSGETIASSPKTSGDTHYTISFLANISSTTPAAVYTGNMTILATGTY